MNAEKIFKDILTMLSDIYQNEGSKNGSLTAEALSLAGNQTFNLKENEDDGKQLLLKMDVEGAEWDTLLQTPDSVLKLFNQIAIEVHGLGTELSRALDNSVPKP